MYTCVVPGCLNYKTVNITQNHDQNHLNYLKCQEMGLQSDIYSLKPSLACHLCNESQEIIEKE